MSNTPSLVVDPVGALLIIVERHMIEGSILGQPSIRIWELDEHSTRYDRLRAAPSDAQMHSMWIGWSIATFLATAFTVIVFFATAFTKKTRMNSFNLYLLALMLPDILCIGGFAVHSAVLAASGGYTHSDECRFQAFYMIWGVIATSWLNGVVAFEVHCLLRQSNQRQRYFPPSARKIAIQTATVYLWAIFLASWCFAFIPRLPFHIDSISGLFCIPLEVDRASTIFFWMVFYPLGNFIPIAYGVWTCISIHYNGLLPPQGKKREIAVFFFRVVIVFVLVWFPSIVTLYMGAGVNIWVAYFSGLWGLLQGAVSVALCMLKSDIRKATIDFIRCRTRQVNRDWDALQRSRMTTMSWNVSRGMSSMSWNVSRGRFGGSSSDQILAGTLPQNVMVNRLNETVDEVKSDMDLIIEEADEEQHVQNGRLADEKKMLDDSQRKPCIALRQKDRPDGCIAALETSEELPVTAQSLEASSDDFTVRTSCEDENV